MESAHPHPGTYRLDAYNNIQINDAPCSADKAFTIKKKGDLELKACEVPRLSVDVYEVAKKYQNETRSAYYGKQQIFLTNEWQALGSLSSEETLLAYHFEARAEVEIRYSQRDNLYYIRSKDTQTAQEVTVDFVVAVPKEVKNALPTPIEHLVKRYQNFGGGGLTMTTPEPTGHDYLKAIQEQKKGVCSHRAFAFKAVMDKERPETPVRIITNDCHAFVEVYFDGQWILQDLGGAEAQLEINEANKPPQPTRTPAPKLEEPPAPKPKVIPAPKPGLPDSSPEARALETWNKAPVAEESVAEFCQKITQPTAGKSHLIECSSAPDVHAIRGELQHYCQHTGRALYYIDSPDDLVCSAPWIERKEMKDEIRGVLTAGPGGRLHRFLTENPDNKQRILLINYANFTPEDIVRLNTILDKEPMIDGVKIPSSVTVVGMANTKSSNHYAGGDFYSRFDTVVPGPKPALLAEARRAHTSAPRAVTPEDTNTTPIYLCHSANWKNELLGRWVMEGTTIIFKEGRLQKAMKAGRPLVIHQGLWENDEFLTFWEQAKLYGRIEHSGGTMVLPKDFELLREDKYEWEHLTKNIQDDERLDEAATFLNPSTLAHFFSRYECDNDTKTLSLKLGFIEACAQTKEKMLPVYLTRELAKDQWAMLCYACHEHGVKLTVHPAPGIALPAVLKIKATPASPPAPAWDKKGIKQEHTLAIHSTDVATTVALLTAEDSGWQVIEVSGCKSHDLLTQVQASFDKEALSFQFIQTKRALLTALEAGKKVILKGTFSPELLDELAPLMRQRAMSQAKEVPLVLVGDNALPSLYVKALRTHEVSIEDKKTGLRLQYLEKELNTLAGELLEKESLSQLKARLTHQRIYRGKDSSEAWLGLTTAPKGVPLAPLNKRDNFAALANAFNQARKAQVMGALAHAPYVYLTGLTGVGKTTFVEKHIKTDETITFYPGDASLKDWASDTNPDKLKIIFIDEANLSHRSWSELEGLFHNPPGILIDGIYYPLSKEHKVILAGNPVAYGDERLLSSMFQQHGNALLFEPLPLACIYEEILKPVFANTELAKDAFAICQPFLEVYRFLLEHSTNELLISPRELQMMAALVLSHHARAPQDRSIDAACHYAHQVTQHLVPQAHRAAFAALPSVVKARSAKLTFPELHSEESLSFLLTPSRRVIAQQITDVLALSELRKDNTTKFNAAQLYGGLGGVVLTGEAGIGKSELVIAVLRQQGYQEQHFKPRLSTEDVPQEDAPVPKKIFYRMPVGLPLSVKQQLILKAFDEGAVLIIDELNSSPMLERWFNDLLMGKHPIEGRPANIPGFCLIGTQNPVTLAGRRRASPASARRLMQVTTPPYEHEEMVGILIQKGVEANKAELLAATYQAKLRQAQINNLTPPPTFRDLLKVVALGLKTLQKEQVQHPAPVPVLKPVPEPVPLSKKQGYRQALEAMRETIAALPAGNVKDSAQAITNIIDLLKAKGEKNLTSYLTITQQLLCATPATRPTLLAQFQKKTEEAQGHPSPLWQKLGKAMLYLGVVIAVVSLFTMAFTGFGLIPAIGIGVSTVSLGVSAGFFASKRPQGLAKAMIELGANIQESQPPASQQ